MAKSKNVRIIINMKCTNCKKINHNNLTITKISKSTQYTTTKNRQNNPERLKLKKFCAHCNSHTLYQEIK
ncbi:unnamed protein product [Choristocarpus tenellus]|uniref:50S ribosomal protein L33 n=1 Tax=Choristocarpus tenellus TaxID=116065 RepID=UPI002E78FC20|nr:50S ribosomal protein L33 [Choristocarpus tenellus]WAM62381.1 50S ribosomal protein L33 [Choristocarpus tenellus]